MDTINIAKDHSRDVGQKNSCLGGKRPWKTSPGLSAIFGILIIGCVGISNKAMADNKVIDVNLSINPETGKVVKVWNKDRSAAAALHESGNAGGHGSHIGKPLPPIVILLGLDGAESGGHMPCPTGYTHVIVAANHYCIQ